MGDRTFTTFQISKLCDVYPTTVINWIEEKKLVAYKTPGGHRRVKRENLILFLKEYNMPITLDDSAEGGRKVMVIDDNPEILDMVETILVKNNFEVKRVMSGFDAGFLLARWTPDLVLLDFLMPDLDGFELCRRIKTDKTTQDIPVIAVSALTAPNDVEKIKKAGADDYLSKPFKSQDLIGKIEFYLSV